MGYRYHVFLSYRHGASVEEWVKRHFMPELESKLNETRLPTPVQIFYDQRSLRAGQNWEATLADALLRSCCIVPIWSPDYFRSRWCLSEWATFRERNRVAGLGADGLVVPVRWQERSHFPPAAATIQTADFSPYAFSAPAFKGDPKFVGFEELVRKFATDVYEAIARAPNAFDPTWPVVTPDPLHAGAGLQTRTLDELHDIEALQMPPDTRIPRVTLAAA